MFKHDDDWSSDIETPLKQNWKAFLKAQPLICDNCGNFTDAPREYCENCGFRHSLRKATKKDFKLYIELKQSQDKFVSKKQIASKSISDASNIRTEGIQKIQSPLVDKKMSTKEKESFLKAYPYFCIKCYNFTDKPEPTGPQKPEKFYYETYCEFCGSSDSIRVATIKDFKLYNEREQTSILDNIKEQKIDIKPRNKISRLEIGEPHLISSQVVKEEEIPKINPKTQTYKVPSTPDEWKQKISAKPITEAVQAETKESPPIISSIVKEEEAPKVSSKAQIQKVPLISDISKIDPSEKLTYEDSQIKVKNFQPIPSKSVKKEVKPKEVSHFCKFCGLKLAKMVKFCHQCGTIIKYE